jgi:polyhydroxyalkanoate synthesis regulator protein
MYGDSMQSMVPHYLEASMDAFTENQTKFRDAALKPFEQLARQNMALFEAATAMLTGAKARAAGGADAPAAPEPTPEPASTSETELVRVKAELAALQARMDGLTRQ